MKNLKRQFTSWILVGGLAAVPILVGGCSTPSSSDSSESQTMPMHGAGESSMPMHQGAGEHAMPMHSNSMANHAMMMDLGPKDAEFDLRFLDAMILHHQGAIAMAENLLENSQRPEMRELGEAIIAAQQTEIDQMKAWRQAWYPNAGVDPIMYHAQMKHSMVMSPDMQAAMMMEGDLGPADAEFDRRFIDAMIPHHEGALAMAEQVLQNSDRPELQELAQNILATQQAEIDQMQQWRQAWYGQ